MNPDLRSIRARDIMKKEPVWAEAAETVRAAAERMQQRGVRAVLVRGDRDGDLPGILTGKDIVNLLGSEDAAILDHAHVADVMTRPAICVPQETNLVDCIQLMRMHGVRRVPVVDGVRVVGILSSSDVFARALQR
ncbi:MAG: cyclic nucleotide-binding/CBS domain-containing protein [Planctomycetota bacterium]